MSHRLRPVIAVAALSLLIGCGASKEVTKAREFIDAGMFDQAIILLKQEVQTSPKNAEAHMLLGVAYLGNGMTALADQELSNALVLDPNLKQETGRRCYEVAKHLLKTNTAQAHVALMKAKEYNPEIDKDEQFFFTAYIDTEENQSARTDAAKRYLTLFPATPNTAHATYELAEGLKSSGDSDQARVYFKQLASQSASTEWGKKASEELANWTETKELVVEAVNANWTDSGLQIHKGDVVTIEASGVIDHGGFKCGPEGNLSKQPYGDAVIPNARYGALVGRLTSSDAVVIGGHYEATAPRDGRLEFLVNDTAGYYNDNSGAFQIRMHIKRNVQ